MHLLDGTGGGQRSSVVCCGELGASEEESSVALYWGDAGGGVGLAGAKEAGGMGQWKGGVFGLRDRVGLKKSGK